MSIIAVNCKGKWSLTQIVKNLAKAIRGNFEVLHTVTSFKSKSKVSYVRLSETLDPVLVIENLKKAHFNAFIPKEVPDLPLHTKKRGKIPLKTRLALGIRVDENLTMVMKHAHKSILDELQCKYTKLYSISVKTNHQLLDSISQTILDRLKSILESDPHAKSGFELTMWYRRRHPHFGDFQLVLGALHALQDAAGAPRSQLQEADLTVVTTQPNVIDNLPYDVVQSACMKYTNKILKKITEHIEGLDCGEGGGSEEEKARSKVRTQLKKLEPYMGEIVQQVIAEQFVPRKSPFYRMRIYGEPALPRKEFLMPLTKQHSCVAVMRSDHMFNLLRFNAPARMYARVMALDGTTVGGVKLVVRSSDLPLYQPKDTIMDQIKTITGEEISPEELEALKQGNEEEDEYMDLDVEEEEEEEMGNEEE